MAEALRLDRWGRRLTTTSTLLFLLLAGQLAAQAPPDAAREAWDAIYIGNAKVGHIHLWITPVQDARGRELLNVRVDYELNLRRGNDIATVRMRYGTIERPDGEVLRLDTRTQAGQQEIRARGDVIDGAMELTLEVGGQVARKRLAWDKDVRGPYGPEMSLSRDPIRPGEVRTVRNFVPDLNEICVTTLKAIGLEEIPLGPKGDTFRLMRVEATLATADGQRKPEFDAVHWVDESGQILKSYVNQLGGITIYRTTKEGALARTDRPLDLLDHSIIPVPRPIASPDRSRAATYEITGLPLETFPTDQRQQAELIRDGVIRLQVRTDTPTTGPAGPAEPDASYLRANPLIDSSDPLISRLARQAVGDARDPWQRAVAIQRWVFQNIRNKNFSTAFEPATAVARDRSGDCTEHSVLTAAMCRAVGVPARCVVGLVYAPDLKGFGPHMWNEVYVQGRWVALDAAFNQSEVDATHLKLADTSLEGVAPFEAFLPVLRVIQPGVRITPIEVR
ncbi:MAG: hypothetical protein KatS3mg108_1791 [Isosphaeraceae bacterium]|jgi:hypothetical protein|nr:MAG: hypothetical protein KatS3mg108_1791 [Isosphaeraceae bacterium]